MLPVNHPKFPPPVSVDAEQRVWWDEFLQSYRLQDIRQELNTLYCPFTLHLLLPADRSPGLHLPLNIFRLSTFLSFSTNWRMNL